MSSKQPAIVHNYVGLVVKSASPTNEVAQTNSDQNTRPLLVVHRERGRKQPGDIHASDFAYLPNTPEISKAVCILCGVVNIPLAEITEVWGLDTGFAFMIFNTLGLLTVAGCQNITTYTVGNVFFQVGFHDLA
ncbi:siderophore iron transporter [Penicillium hispanicum]|uniref:siderophore iron transporter n=1 Tax=Penicillium hispanicum TaxID=1080232 RepID=UPI0025409B84|nr:siderophore iron transporter [Penicillium hispanicum]KAJ5591494.1 siderophore iron transporter [Penicillium hispanicum]